MKRKIYNELLKWKEKESHRTALLIDGARRVGKSYIAEKFGANEYKSYILIDFFQAGNDVKDLFENYLNDLDTFFKYLSAIYGTKLYEHNSLIIFDEIQFYPRARAAIKYLVKDGRYSYLETGSLISIKENVKDILIPSEERHIKMYPMDFEEFLWATGNESLMEIVRENFDNKKPMGQVLHRKAMNCFRQYLIIGGMPQAVSEYVQTDDLENVDQIKRNILTLYRNDISKHAIGYDRKVTSIFDEIPSQLQKHEKRFTLSSLGRSARFREYEKSFLYLDDSMIINTCYNSTAPNIGLKLNRDNSSMKIYLADTGLLISHTFDEESLEIEQV
ncbi:MAG: AAA family ATPase, partial [Spirochaetales bacterium]|nr:AAA family ATPase [Spirochaetales bacterium]